MPAAITSLSGSIWHGQATLVGGHVAQWSVLPWASLGHAALVAQWSLQGPGTQLQGSASLRSNSLRASAVDGRASWRLVSALAPTLPVTCDLQARVAINEVVIVGNTLETLDGEVRSGPALCAANGAGASEPVEVPPLRALATTDEQGPRVNVTSADDAATPLARATLSAQNTLALTLLPRGAKLIPGMPSSGETLLEIPL